MSFKNYDISGKDVWNYKCYIYHYQDTSRNRNITRFYIHMFYFDKMGKPILAFLNVFQPDIIVIQSHRSWSVASYILTGK